MQERAHQFLLYNSSGINAFGKRTVQAGNCLHSEQLDTLFICVGGSGRGFGGEGGHFGQEARNT